MMRYIRVPFWSFVLWTYGVEEHAVDIFHLATYGLYGIHVSLRHIEVFPVDVCLWENWHCCCTSSSRGWHRRGAWYEGTPVRIPGFTQNVVGAFLKYYYRPGYRSSGGCHDVGLYTCAILKGRFVDVRRRRACRRHHSFGDIWIIWNIRLFPSHWSPPRACMPFAQLVLMWYKQL